MDIDNKIIEVIEQQENVIKEIYSKAQNEIAYYNGWLGEFKIPKERICIMWNHAKIDGRYKILHIIIAGFDTSLLKGEDSDDWKICKSPSDCPMYLWDLFGSTVGYCNAWWPEANIYQEIFRILHDYEFISHQELRRFLDEEVGKIKEIDDTFKKISKGYRLY